MSSELDRKKILIVEDELDLRIFLCNLLGNCGYEPIDASDKTEGCTSSDPLGQVRHFINRHLP